MSAARPSPPATVGRLGELGLIERLSPWLPRRSDIAVGAGDDCAVVTPTPESAFDLVLKSDPVIRGRHFLADADPRQVGHKAVGRVLSDLAAMGAEPRWALVDLVLPPDLPLASLDRLYAGMLELGARHGLALVGGDTSQGDEFAVHVFGCGMLPRGTARLRSGARTGDVLYVTGALGGSLAGRHLTFEPRVREGRWLRDWATAMIDISDGLASELWHLATAAPATLAVRADALPLSASARAATPPRSALEAALYDGEDFELLFGIAAGRRAEFEAAWAEAFPALPCTAIGEVLARAAAPGVRLVRADWTESLLRGGFEHFRDAADRCGAEVLYEVRNEAGTVALAEELGRRFGAGTVFALQGGLGAGKTRFAQGLAAAAGVRGAVTSPTFALIQEHAGDGGARFSHMDWYRLDGEPAVLDLGFEEYLERGDTLAIEWPGRAPALLPPGTVHVAIEPGPSDDARTIRVRVADTNPERPD